MYRNLLLFSVAIAASAAGAEPARLDDAYRQMYNLQFTDAHRTLQEWQKAHPRDPMGPVSDAAASLFSEFDRLHILQSEFFTHDQHFITDNKLTPDPVLRDKFRAALQASRTLASATVQEKDSQFALILCSGLESDYQALIEKRYAASFQSMKSGRQMAEKLLAADPTYYDAWIAVGIENYMLSIKPAPIRWLLRLGGGQANRAYGMEKLKLAAERGHYLAPFARLLLAVAALRDKNDGTARLILAKLTQEYPQNHLYKEELARLDPIALRSNPL